MGTCHVIVYKVSGTEGHPKTLVIVPFLPWSFCNDDAYRPNVTEIVYTLFVATIFVATIFVVTFYVLYLCWKSKIERYGNSVYIWIVCYCEEF